MMMQGAARAIARSQRVRYSLGVKTTFSGPRRLWRFSAQNHPCRFFAVSAAEKSIGLDKNSSRNSRESWKPHPLKEKNENYGPLADLTPKDAEWISAQKSLLSKPPNEALTSEDWHTAEELLQGLRLGRNPLLKLEEENIRDAFAILDRLCAHLEQVNTNNGDRDASTNRSLDVEIWKDLMMSWRIWAMGSSVEDEVSNATSSSEEMMNVKEEFGQVLDGSTKLSSFMMKLWEQTSLSFYQLQYTEDNLPKQRSTLLGSLSCEEMRKRLQSYVERGLFEYDSFPFFVLAHVAARMPNMEHNIGLIKEIIEWMENDPSQFEINPIIYSEMLMAYRNAGLPEKCDIALRHIVTNGSPRDSFFSIAIAAWAESDNPERVTRARELVKLSEEAGIPLSSHEYSAMINVYARSAAMDATETIKKCEHVLFELELSGISPGLSVLNSLLNVYAKHSPSDSIQKGMKTLAEMREKGIGPDIISYSTMLDICAKSKDKDSLVHAERIWKDMTSNYTKMIDKTSYSSLMNVYAKHSPPDSIQKGMKLLAEMKERGIEPDIISYSTMLTICAKSKDKDSVVHAERIWEGMTSNYTKMIDKTSYNSLMNVYAKHSPPDSLQRGMKLLAEMRESGVEPNIITYNTMLVICAKSKDKDSVVHAERICKDMTASNAKLIDKTSYTSLMNVYAKHSPPDSLQRGKKVLAEMRERGIEPDIISYSTMLGICAKSKDKDSVVHAERIWEDMTSNYTKMIDTASYNSLMNVYAKHSPPDSIQKGMKLLAEMRESGVEPNIITYNTMLDICARSKDKDSIFYAEEIWQTVVKGGVQPNTRFFNLMIENYANSRDHGSLQKIQMLLDYMKENSVSFNEYSYIAYMNALMKFRRPATEVESIFREALQSCPDVANQPSIYNIRLNSWSQAGEPEMTAKVLNEKLKYLKRQASSKDFNKVLASWMNSRRPESAEKCEDRLKQMMHLYETKGMDCLPNSFSFSAAVSCHINLRSRDMAQRILWILEFFDDTLEKYGHTGKIRPHLRIYVDALKTQVITSRANPRQNEENAWSILHRIANRFHHFQRDEIARELPFLKEAIDRSGFPSKREMQAKIQQLESAHHTRGGKRRHQFQR